MANGFKMKCYKCGVLLRIHETGELFRGSKERKDAPCPNCQYNQYKK